MENQDHRPTIFFPQGTNIFIPALIRAEMIGTPGRRQPAPAPVPVTKMEEVRSRSRRPSTVDQWPAVTERPAVRERKALAKRPAWMDIPLDEEEDDGGPDGPMSVPPEIMALAEEAATQWEMAVSQYTLAATKPEKGWGAIWRIDTDRGPRSLKLLHRPFERNLFSIYAQEYLTEQQFRVAPLVRSRQSELYTIVQDRMFIVTDWIEGLHPATKLTPDGAAALCYGLGEFHRHSQGYVPPPRAYNASRLHRWPGVYQKMRAKIDWFEHLAKAYSDMPASSVLLEVLPRFRAQADEAMERLERSAYLELIARGDQAWGLVHQGEGDRRATSRAAAPL